MGRSGALLMALLLAMVLAPSPAGQAAPVECELGAPCDPVVVCVVGPTCAANPCGPVLCQASVEYGHVCDHQEDIDGETCQRSVEASTSVSAGQVRLVETHSGVAATDGGVRMLNLRNAWFSHSVQSGARVADVDAGTTSATLYRSDIDTSNDNTVTQVGVGVSRSEGSVPGSSADVVSGVVFMENQPRGCFVRATPGASVDCPQGVLFLLI